MATDRPFGLGEAQERCVRYLCAGYTVAEVARMLGVEQSTVKTNLAVARRKMGVSTQCALVAKWIRDVENGERVRASYLRGVYDASMMRRAERAQLRAIVDERDMRERRRAA